MKCRRAVRETSRGRCLEEAGVRVTLDLLKPLFSPGAYIPPIFGGGNVGFDFGACELIEYKAGGFHGR